MSLSRALMAVPVLLALGACNPTSGGLPPAGSGQVVIVAGMDGPNTNSSLDVDWNGYHDACLAYLPYHPPGLWNVPAASCICTGNWLAPSAPDRMVFMKSRF